MSRTVCFFACCKTKSEVKPETTRRCSFSVENTLPPDQWEQLKKAREKMRYCVCQDSSPIPAIYLYDGHFYKELKKNNNIENVLNNIEKGLLRIFIISAGYGVVDACEPIQKYDAIMDKKIAEFWEQYGLAEIISHLLLKLNPEKVFGFFTKKSKYKEFFEEGVKRAKEEGLQSRVCGCFSGNGTPALRLLGRTFVELMRNDFSDQFISDFQHKSGQIKFERYDC
jgi:hypothetical protein